MRVLPLENEAINECWLADRDRFSYEALEQRRAPDRADDQAGRRVEDRRLADGARIRGARPEADQGRPRRATASARWSARTARSRSCTCSAKLVRGLGSDNIDYRLRRRAVRQAPTAQSRWLGTLDRVAVAAAARARRSARSCARTIRCSRMRVRAAPCARARRCRRSTTLRRRLADADRRAVVVAPAAGWVQALADVAAAVAAEQGVARAGRKARRPTPPRRSRSRCSAASARPSCWATPPRSMPNASELLALAQLDRPSRPARPSAT